MKWLLIGCIAGFLFGIVLKLPKLVGLGLPSAVHQRLHYFEKTIFSRGINH